MVGAELAGEKRNELLGLLAAHFTRWELARQAGKYIDGLMSDLPDKTWALPNGLKITAVRGGRTGRLQAGRRPCSSGRSARFKSGGQRPGGVARGPTRLTLSSDWLMGV